MKTFGTLVSEARRAKGLSQKDLAAKVKKALNRPLAQESSREERALSICTRAR